MKLPINLLLVSLVFAVILIGGNEILVASHEAAHAQNCKYLGGTPTTTINYLTMSGDVSCAGVGMDFPNSVDGMNDAWTYQFREVFIGIGLMIWFACLVIEGREK